MSSFTFLRLKLTEVFVTDEFFEEKLSGEEMSVDSEETEFDETASSPDTEQENAHGYGDDEHISHHHHSETGENYLVGKTKKTDKKTLSVSKEVFEWLEVIVTAMVAVVIVFSLFFRVATIDGQSMENTLFGNEKVILSNVAYKPEQGDIVVISRNVANTVKGSDKSQLPIIKRVIAVAGQTVDIDFENGIVYVDGEALKETYTKTPTNLRYPDGPEFPLTVKEGHVFVLGDNRNDSLDSRSSRIGENGQVDTRYILGHAIFRIYPFDRIGGL